MDRCIFLGSWSFDLRAAETPSYHHGGITYFFVTPLDGKFE